MKEGVGKTYDLQSLFERLNRIYFDSSLKLNIRWSKRAVTAAKRRVTLGSFSMEEKEITISKRLDDPRVPLFFLEHVLFHEMLHAIFPSEKHKMHSMRFKTFEKLHPDFERARIWEKNSIAILFNKPQQQLPLLTRAAEWIKDQVGA